YPYRPVGNPYSALFGDGLSQIGWTVHEYLLGSRRERPSEILHVHWPERAVSARNRGAGRAKFELFLRDVRRVRRVGGRVIWTAHNAVPHDARGDMQRAFRRFVDQVDGVVHLSRTGRAEVEATY